VRNTAATFTAQVQVNQRIAQFFGSKGPSKSKSKTQEKKWLGRPSSSPAHWKKQFAQKWAL